MHTRETSALTVGGEKTAPIGIQRGSVFSIPLFLCFHFFLLYFRTTQSPITNLFAVFIHNRY